MKTSDLSRKYYKRMKILVDESIIAVVESAEEENLRHGCWKDELRLQMLLGRNKQKMLYLAITSIVSTSTAIYIPTIWAVRLNFSSDFP